MPLFKLLTKPTILFFGLNLLRVLSIVGICLVFAGEIYTMVTDIQGFQHNKDVTSSSSFASATSTSGGMSAATASTLINVGRRRRSLGELAGPEPEPASTAVLKPLSARAFHAHAAPTAAPTEPARFHRVVRRSGRHAKREPLTSSTLDVDETTTTSSKKAKTTSTDNFSAALPTATNAPLLGSAPDTTATTEMEEEDNETTCAYVGKTSIPRTAGGVVFSTLERIFCAFVLLLSLLSELPLPPRLFLLTQSFWTSAFPPFGAAHGVGVLGVVEVFLGCVVLGKAVAGWVQGAVWVLFLVGIFNLLAGLAFGKRINPLRSLSADSTSPSALRKLRLASQGDPPAGSSYSSYYTMPDDSTPARQSEPEMVEGESFRPSRIHTPIADGMARSSSMKRSGSRNGPNGIVISPPRPMRPSMSASGSETGEASGARMGGVSPPPPIYFPGSRA
ncbi:hypothetical protein JCM10207_009225 [Rhodosporidiobolus poonsookiae]